MVRRRSDYPTELNGVVLTVALMAATCTLSFSLGRVLAGPKNNSEQVAAEEPKANEAQSQNEFPSVRPTLKRLFTVVEQGRPDAALVDFTTPAKQAQIDQLAAALKIISESANNSGYIVYISPKPAPKPINQILNDFSLRIYADAKHAWAMYPVRSRNEPWSGLILRLAYVDGDWKVQQIDKMDSRKLIHDLIQFRQENPKAESRPYLTSQSYLTSPEVRKRAEALKEEPNFSLDQATWKKAVEQAVSYARQFPASRPARPEGLADLTQDQIINQMEELVHRNITLLSEQDNEVRYAAQTRLRYLGRPAIDALIKTLSAKNPKTRLAALNVIRDIQYGNYSEPVWEQLQRMLRSDESSSVRSDVVWILSHWDDPRIVPAIVERVESDTEWAVRSRAIRLLKDIHDERAFQSLQKVILRKRDPQKKYKSQQQNLAKALQAIDSKRAWPIIMQAALNETSDGEREQLIRYASDPPDNYGRRMWPARLQSVQPLIRDVYTFAGEFYGESEIRQLIDLIDEQDITVANECCRAIGHLQAKQAIPQLLKVSREKHGGSSQFQALVRLGTPQIVEHIAGRIEKSNTQQRRLLASHVCNARPPRWAAPLFIALLEDASLRREYPAEFIGNDYIPAYASHTAHGALCSILGTAGLVGKWQNLAADGHFDLDEEIIRLKSWWKKHGKAFMQNQPTPNPKLTRVYIAT